MTSSEPIELKIELDPWTKLEENRQPLPPNARLACVYELNFGLDSLPEMVCFHRDRGHDELWLIYPDVDVASVPFPEILAYSEIRGRVARAPRAGKPQDAARRLLRKLVRSRTGFAWPVRWLAGDLVDEATYTKVLEDVKSGLDRNAAAARKQSSASIIKAARKLGLDPEPNRTSPTAWRARCPGTKHPLYISSESNTFGCGWCKRKGGAEELSAFVAERTPNEPRKTPASRSRKGAKR